MGTDPVTFFIGFTAFFFGAGYLLYRVEWGWMVILALLAVIALSGGWIIALFIGILIFLMGVWFVDRPWRSGTKAGWEGDGEA